MYTDVSPVIARAALIGSLYGSMLIIFGILEPGIICGKSSNREEEVIPLTLEGLVSLDLINAKQISEDSSDNSRY